MFYPSVLLIYILTLHIVYRNILYSLYYKCLYKTYGGWIYNYLCNQCLSPLTLWVPIPLRRGLLDTTLCDKVCQWLATGRWFSPVTQVSSTNKTDRHDIAEILLKVALNTITMIYFISVRMGQTLYIYLCMKRITLI
jgi:hypothetical protein